MEAHMPKKRQSNQKDKRPSKSKANLGQTEAEMEKIGKEQMSHMEGGKARKTARQQSTKPGTK
jgi:hypothetical protein